MASHAHRPLLGIVYINVALMILACNEALIRLLTEDYSPIQIAFIRFVVMAILVGAAIVGMKRRELFQANRWWLLVLRGVLGAIASGSFFFSIKFLELDDATTISLSAPIFVAALSGWLLRERVPAARWGAVVLGFVGVAIVMRPGAGLFNIWAFVAFISAGAYALAMMVNRVLTRTEDSLTIIFYFPLFGSLTLLPFMPFLWTSTPASEFPMLFAVGLLAGITQYLMMQAYRFAAANTVITFDYMGVLYIAIISYLVFAEIPSWNLIAGAVLLIASGIFIVYDEARQLKRMAGESKA
ncbi:MAG: DMT family transporter [Pseudomonadota bacterium]